MSDQPGNDNGGAPGPEGGEGANWREGLPEPLRDAPFFKAAGSLEEAVSQIGNAASHMGNSVRVPSEDASDEDRHKFVQKILEKTPNLMMKPTDEDLDSFYNSMGRPSKPDEYRFDLPEGKEVPEDFEHFRKAAHEAGLTQTQFEKLLGDVLNPVFENQEVTEAEQRQSLKELSKEWGLAYDSNVNALKNFLDVTDAPQGIRDLLESEAMSTDEMRWLHSIAKQTGDPQELASQRGTVTNNLSPADARDRIQEILNNSDHPYWNSTDPRHRDAIDKMIKLQRMANPK